MYQDYIEGLRAKINHVEGVIDQLKELQRDCAGLIPSTCESIYSFDMVLAQAQSLRFIYNQAILKAYKDRNIDSQADASIGLSYIPQVGQN